MTKGSLETPDDLHRLAAEFALSLLDEAEQRTANRRYASDPAFRSAVEAWRGHFAEFVDDLSPLPPSSAVWHGLQGRIGSPPAGQAGPAPGSWWTHVGLWRTTALAAMTVAAMLAVTVLPRGGGSGGNSGGGREPPPRTSTAAVTLGAALLPKDGPALLVVTHEAGSERLVAVPTGRPWPQAGRSVLWLLRGDDDPVMIGAVERGRMSVLAVSRSQAAELVAGTILVVTQDADGPATGSPASPGPVVAKGVLEEVRT